MDLQSVATSSVVASAVALLLNRGFEWQANSAKARAMLRGILLEIDHAEKCASAYLNDSQQQPWAPGYRLGVEFMSTGLPAIAGLGKARADEVASIHALYVVMGDANRSLDLLTDYAAMPPLSPKKDFPFLPYAVPPSPLQLETSRARVKFASVLKLIAPARKATEAALTRMAWYDQG